MWIEIEADPNSRPQMKQMTDGLGILGLRVMDVLELINYGIRWIKNKLVNKIVKRTN